MSWIGAKERCAKKNQQPRSTNERLTGGVGVEAMTHPPPSRPASKPPFALPTPGSISGTIACWEGL